MALARTEAYRKWVNVVGRIVQSSSLSAAIHHSDFIQRFLTFISDPLFLYNCVYFVSLLIQEATGIALY